jgi:Domain of unknown function (DUF4111)/Nucleotidyltransferase domain
LRSGGPLQGESDYLAAVRERLRAALRERLVGVYAGGSYALGDYLPARSDLDVAAVVESPLSPETAEALVANLRHESLPCPACRLELVVYLEETARSGAAVADFELNLNSGAELPVSVQWRGAPGDVGDHWFAIDRSILAPAGVALFGPPAREVFAAIAPAELAPTLVESVRWHEEREADTSDAVLNACRSLRYATEGWWSSKPGAGRWAAETRQAPADLATQALDARATGSPLDVAEVERFLSEVEARLRPERT